MELHRLGVPAVNHIYYVYLRWGYVFSNIGWVVVLGNMSCTGGGWVRYIKIWRMVIILLDLQEYEVKCRGLKRNNL